MKNLYLDVDGVVVRDDLVNTGKEALELGSFLLYLNSLQEKGIVCMYWLTTNCKNGTNQIVLKFLKSKLSPANYDLVVKMKIKPTAWNEFKTEAIDFTQDFFWLDDDAILQEREILHTHGVEDKLIEIDLQKNESQLKDIVQSKILE